MLALILAAGCDRASDASTDTAAVAEPEVQTPAASDSGAPAAEAEAPARAEVPAADRIDLAQAETGSDPVAAAGFVSGQHYRRLPTAQPTSSSGGRVEVVEFFMYSCIHCYNLEPYIEEWLTTKPAYIDFVRVPTTWDAPRQLHAQAFYAAKALGKLEEMHTPFFREMHVTGNYLTSVDAMAEFFSRFGVGRDEFRSAFESFSVVNTEMRRAADLGNRYRIDSTPTIIVNGKYRTGADMAGSPERLFELIEALAAAERGQG
jgi:thiol:disulfide interchange protein DsbA